MSESERPSCDGQVTIEHRAVAGESRDTECAAALWYQKASKAGLPAVSAFDFSRLTSDWSYRFLIAGDEVVEDAVFLVYGPRFVRLLGLPDKPLHYVPVIKQLPPRYRALFAEGYGEAITRLAPARFSGAVVRPDGEMELYRAAFMPVQGAKASTSLILGTFNYRTLSQESASDAFAKTQAGWSEAVWEQRFDRGNGTKCQLNSGDVAPD